DRHVKDASKDPQMDSSQDYRLLLGYENKTHTVLRFSRRYDTCDPRDLKITKGGAQDNFLRSVHKAREIYLGRLSYASFTEINAFISCRERLI
ncbi:MOXD1 like protein 2, partial [Cyphomyrmex costatus]